MKNDNSKNEEFSIDTLISSIFSAIEPELEKNGFRIDEGDDDTVCITHIESGIPFSIKVIAEDEE